jgi:hypothetical protein
VIYYSSFSNLTFNITNSVFVLSVEEQILAETLWQKKTKTSKSWFNGENYACFKHSSTNGQESFDIGKSDYKTYTWIRENNIERPGGYLCGLIVFVFDSDKESFALMKRTKDVGFDLYKLSTVGGTIPYKNNNQNIMDIVEKQAYNEINEELDFSDITTPPKLIGVAFDQLTYYLNFCYFIHLKNISLKGVENNDLIFVKPDNIEEYLHNSKYELEKSTKIHLSNNIKLLSETNVL